MDTEGSGAAGCSVGSIVWVRRRNGSWWPGKILGPEELSSSHLTSPRSGTPVKLLGREDASVDWYNLEKSKRVKAFRCGEFDDCIEKAESSQGMLIKKREKYARREDAILHALELEKQLLKKQGKLGVASHSTNSKPSSCMQKGLVTASESLGDDNEKPGNSNLHVFSRRIDMYHKDEIISDPLSSRKVKDGNQLSGEDDHPEIPPRMRGLQDFGLRIAPSKRKVPSSVTSNGCQKPTADNHAHTLPSDGALSMENASHANGVERTGVNYRAKRSRCVYLPTESSDSLDYNEISPSQIEMSASQFGTGNHRPNPDSLIEENSSGFMEDVESDSSETDSSESESDSSETEPDMDEEMPILSGVAVPTEAEQNALGRSEAEEHGSMSTDEHDESASSGDDVSHLYPDHVTANEAVSKWRLKGKRNIRSLPKRFMDATDGKGSIHGTYPEEKGSASSQRALGKSLRFCRNGDFNDVVDEADMNEKDFRTQMVRLDDGYSLKSKAASRGRNMNDWEGLAWEDQPALKGYWDVKRERFGPVYDARHHFGGRPRSMLVNVDLKVQASYQKEPVPIVSLMSKLNGKAIIGHPIQIEALEDGSSKTFFSAINDFGNEAIDNENSALSPSWRTARRTANFRVPRPHLSTALGGDETTDDPPILDEERKVPFKKLNVGSFGQKASPQIPRPPIDRKLPRKQPKKVSISSSQKTRTLSSIAIDQNFSIKPKHDSNSCQMDGLIKPESSGPTTVACIPVKLVFSRLLEKINRPPSSSLSLTKAAASTNGVLLNSDVERNQS